MRASQAALALSKVDRAMRSEDRTIKILEAGVKLATKKGINGFKRGDLATAAKVSPSLINSYIGGMEEMRAAVKKYAKKVGVVLADDKPKAARKTKAAKVIDSPVKPKAARKPKAMPVIVPQL